jgi:hypothetical protein
MDWIVMTLLNPKQAAQFCTDNGRPTERSSLDTMRSTGGGPSFYKEKGKKNVWYSPDDLLEWAKSTPMEKYSSTSEYSTRKKKTPKPNGAPPEDKPSEDKSSDPSPDDGEGE